MYLFFDLIAILICLCVGVVGISSLFSWYELANQQPHLMANRLSPKHLGRAFGFMLVETLCLTLTVLLHPLGWVPPWRRSIPAETTPVILLHGLFHNRACWLWLKLRLRMQGVRSLHSINLPPWKNVEGLTERVANKVDELRQAGGIPKVHLIGHSMGGIIARNYLQIRGGAQKVDHCILLAAPNSGSRLAALALSPLAAILMPGSELLQRLAAAPMPPGARVTNIYSRHDNMVLPPENAHLNDAHNIELTGLGHSTLLYHPRVIKTLLALLSEQSP